MPELMNSLALETFASAWWDRTPHGERWKMFKRVGIKHPHCPDVGWYALDGREATNIARTIFEHGILVVCRCQECPWCDGSGSERYYETDVHMKYVPIPCTECNGAKVLVGECRVHTLAGATPSYIATCCAEYNLGEHGPDCRNYPEEVKS